jgi:hypothetical protein
MQTIFYMCGIYFYVTVFPQTISFLQKYDLCKFWGNILGKLPFSRTKIWIFFCLWCLMTHIKKLAHAIVRKSLQMTRLMKQLNKRAKQGNVKTKMRLFVFTKHLKDVRLNTSLFIAVSWGQFHIIIFTI